MSSRMLFKLSTLFILISLFGCSTSEQKAKALSDYKIALVSNRDGNYEIYTMTADGQNLTRITHNEAYDFGPRWSPDGKKIAFNSNRDGDSEIYVMDANGSNLTRITDNEIDEWNPHWSPDGLKLIFDSGMYKKDKEDKNSEICIVDANGANWMRLTDNNFRDHDPVFSADGGKIAFLSHREEDNLGAAEIYIMDAAGSNEKRMTYNQQHETIMSFSRDGSKLVFTQHPKEGSKDDEIYILDINSGELTNLSQNSASDEHAFWAPNGEKIIFDSTRDGGELQLYVINPDGSNPVRVTQDSAHMYFWSSIWAEMESH